MISRNSNALVTLAVLALAQLATPATGQAQRWTLPDSVQEAVDEVFSFIGRDDPGCALGVVQDGKLAYGRGYGLANLDWRIPICTSSVFDIGSVSKQFTAAALALLEMDGVLSLDDDVRRWIPEFPDYGHTITLRNLLNHTSGVRDYLTLESIAGFDFDNVYDEFDGVEMITRQQGLNFEPGSEYLYSNSGYLLLANVVRHATGESLRTFLEHRVFDPLGMARTSVWDDNTEILAERATGYAPADDEGRGWRIDHAWNFQMGGDGQVITSVEDLVKWDANFYDPVVGGQGLLDRLHTRGVLTDGDTIPYALGLVLDEYRGLRRVQHGGAWAGFRAALARFRDERTSVIALCNRAEANAPAYASAVADAVLAGRFPVEAVAEPAEVEAEAGAAAEIRLGEEQLARWIGLYRQPERPAYFAFEVEEGKLVARRGDRRYVLVPRSATEFEAEGPGFTLTFSHGEDGRDRVRLGSDEYHGVTPGAPSSLEDFVGTYHSDELQVDFEVELEDDRLRVRRVGEEGMLLEPGVNDEFYNRFVSLIFEREASRVVGFRMYAGRVTDLRFQRKGS